MTPLTSRAAVVELIAATTTKTGLKVECALDERTYEKGIKISDAEMATLDIRGDTFHPDWNYTSQSLPPQALFAQPLGISLFYSPSIRQQIASRFGKQYRPDLR